MKAFDVYNSNTLTIVIELKLDEVNKLNWMKYSNDSTMTPLHLKLLNFVNLQAQSF